LGGLIRVDDRPVGLALVDRHSECVGDERGGC
jgi:hypothetical protein